VEQISSEDREKAEKEKLDRETIQRLLGALGLVDATLFDYEDPNHIDEQWIVRGQE
jgi:hypothetical protein